MRSPLSFPRLALLLILTIFILPVRGQAIRFRQSAQNTATFSIPNALAAGGMMISGPPTQTGTKDGYAATLVYNVVQIDIAFTGTQCVLESAVQFASALPVSVDGGPVTNVPITDTMSAVTLASGLSEGAHTVSFNLSGAGQFYLNTDTGIRVTGTSPALGTLQGYGEIYRLHDSAAALTGTAPLPWVNYDNGDEVATVNSDDGDVAFFSPEEQFSFYATYTSFQVFARTNSPGITVFQDGRNINSNNAMDNTGTGNNFRWFRLAANLDGARHLYQVKFTNLGNGAYAYSKLLTGTGGFMDTTAPPPAKTHFLMSYGDSITACNVIGDSTQGYTSLTAATKGWGDYIVAQGGRTIYDTGDGNAGDASANINTALARSPAPDVLTILLGINDGPRGTSQSSIQASYQDMLTRLVDGTPDSTQIYCIKLLPVYNGSLNGTNTTSYYAFRPPTEASIEAAISAFQAADPARAARVHLVDISAGPGGAFNPAVHTQDGLHPNAAGYAVLSANLLSILNPVYTITGMVTLTGWQGAPQPLTFTLTPASGGAPIVQTLTPAADGSFSLSGVPANLYILGIKGSRWLRTNVSVTTMAGNAAGVEATLRPGDINNDNQISGVDLAMVRKAYGSSPGTRYWNANADLDGDGHVTMQDLTLLRQHYGVSGDK